jgi:hypothetical protein
MQTNSSHESEAEESKAVVEDGSKIQVTTEEKQKDAMGETLVCSICQVQKSYGLAKKKEIEQQYYMMPFCMPKFHSVINGE